MALTLWAWKSSSRQIGKLRSTRWRRKQACGPTRPDFGGCHPITNFNSTISNRVTLRRKATKQSNNPEAIRGNGWAVPAPSCQDFCRFEALNGRATDGHGWTRIKGEENSTIADRVTPRRKATRQRNNPEAIRSNDWAARSLLKVYNLFTSRTIVLEYILTTFDSETYVAHMETPYLPSSTSVLIRSVNLCQRSYRRENRITH